MLFFCACGKQSWHAYSGSGGRQLKGQTSLLQHQDFVLMAARTYCSWNRSKRGIISLRIASTYPGRNSYNTKHFWDKLDLTFTWTNRYSHYAHILWTWRKESKHVLQFTQNSYLTFSCEVPRICDEQIRTRSWGALVALNRLSQNITLTCSVGIPTSSKMQSLIQHVNS